MKKILIVDDSVMDLKLIKAVLKRGHVQNECLLAHDGDEGLEILQKEFEEICLILLDWQMPKVDGMDFLKAAKYITDSESIPVVMVTASGSAENKKYAREVNPNLAGYVVKPFSPKFLINTISCFLQ